MSEYLIKPGTSLGHYPQRPEATLDDLEAVLSHWGSKLRARFAHKHSSQRSIARRVRRHEAALRECTEQEFDTVLEEIRWRLHHQGLLERHVIDCFAVICEAAARTLDKRHYDTQLYGGWLMMNGMLAEMQTGEGKTLTTTLPACTAALGGVRVHVITANDYLRPARLRNHATAIPTPGIEFQLGSRRHVAGRMSQGLPGPISCTPPTSKSLSTTCAIASRWEKIPATCASSTASCKIRLEPGKGAQLMLRGLCFAIVDEADSVLVDEANTPLDHHSPDPRRRHPGDL